MALSKQYQPQEAEPRLQQAWSQAGIYNFNQEGAARVFSIDTPPPTVSGYLHLGHVYSYSHTDFIARFKRMTGRNVFYPMGFDDNGLPTERLVEKRTKMTAASAGREAFIAGCLKISEEAEVEYRALWQRLGLSVDWRYTYRTIDARSRRIAQWGFIDLHRKGLVYRQEAPAIWCPECHTALAQADQNDLERRSEFITLRFAFEDAGDSDGLEIATTRPELLAACVAVFVPPSDRRYQGLAGRTVRTPLFDQVVPILEDPAADPEKGTGAVMCCTFGDTTDVDWWQAHQLPMIDAIDPHGRMTAAAGPYAELPVEDARRKIKADLEIAGLILDRRPTDQTIRVHERCDTPVEIRLAPQWFIDVLNTREQLLERGEQVAWHPPAMRRRYQIWVEGLNWDWCISRQRAFGVPFPAWYCRSCGAVTLADEGDLPVDPTAQSPHVPCHQCGGNDFSPDMDVMDTWATSSLSPQIAGGWQDNPELYDRVFPFSLRSQAHEIIRTWAFYTLVQSQAHFDSTPWENIQISGWGIAGEGMGKISKSRGGGPMGPMEMIGRYSADALRYWASSGGPGKDLVISEDKIQSGARLATKLWNVARFCEPFLAGATPAEGTDLTGEPLQLTEACLTFADRWILARLQTIIAQATDAFQEYDYASARGTVESFFWRDLADNYLEMCKQRLYDPAHPQRAGAIFALRRVLLDTIKLLAPILPYVTEAIYQGLFTRLAQEGDFDSIHHSAWPQVDPPWVDPMAEFYGEALVSIATAVRRYKSEHSLALGSEMESLHIAPRDWGAEAEAATPPVGPLPTGTPPGSGAPVANGQPDDGLPASAPATAEQSETWERLQDRLSAALPDLLSITRVRRIEFNKTISPGLELLPCEGGVCLGLEI